MIPRYSRPEMATIWNRQAYFEKQQDVELAAVNAWAREGRIPKDDAVKLMAASFTLERIDELEKVNDHETNAFVDALAESVGPESRWLHLGLTSSDVLDTGLALQLADSAILIAERLSALEEALTYQAITHKYTLMIGRSHGVHAEPITFGLKLLLWVDEIRRHRERFDHARTSITVGKISGSVGTHANVPPQVEEWTCKSLGLAVAPVSNQIVQRDRHAHFVSAMAQIASSLDKFSTELRSLQRTEIREVEEPFEIGRHGSSSMPHKRNPSRLERISGLARVLRAHAQVALENVTLWHERDISHSSAERVILPDACIALDYMLWLFTSIAREMRVYPKRMAENVEMTGGLIYSQGVMLALVQAGLSRQDAYERVQTHALNAWDNGGNFKFAILNDDTIQTLLTPEEIAAVFSPDPHLQWIDSAFKRMNIPDTNESNETSTTEATSSLPTP